MKGDKTVYTTINNNEKECLTVLISGNAAGVIAPPMILFRYKQLPAEICKNIPSHWGVGCSETGWMTCETFYSYITNIFYPWLKQQNITLPIILFVDGHSSHMSLHFSNVCQQSGIILVSLYPNSTHITQPMDVAIFRTLKTGLKKSVFSWRLENQSGFLTRVDCAPLLKSTIKSRITPEILQNGF
ncbi:hypothetical protein PR048_023164 [Dryococelus australis]|uniref:DDE-1 domain-containing protein n=1 Tax=Dryococelus australis TaxID=614101 RepID=A0ABQ9GTB1_9NEOP|nr:hypothetical protein PR048_023164 [Dryococelus australis]